MKLELICRIDKARWDEGLEAARKLGEYDTWHEVWRVPIEGEMSERLIDPPNATWWEAVTLCQKNGWMLSKPRGRICRM